MLQDASSQTYACENGSKGVEDFGHAGRCIEVFHRLGTRLAPPSAREAVGLVRNLLPWPGQRRNLSDNFYYCIP